MKNFRKLMIIGIAVAAAFVAQYSSASADPASCVKDFGCANTGAGCCWEWHQGGGNSYYGYTSAFQ
jgi:hypothetical protein